MKTDLPSSNEENENKFMFQGPQKECVLQWGVLRWGEGVSYLPSDGRLHRPGIDQSSRVLRKDGTHSL